jgi:hypothetical protein
MKNTLFILFFTFSIFNAYTQQGIGTNDPHPSSILELKSTTKGFLMPRMINTQMDALSSSAVQGLMAYCTDCTPKGIYIYDAGVWATSVSTFNFSIRQVTGANDRVWMLRDLGASKSDAAATDLLSYGDLYQWGRRTDGHEKWDSTVIAVLADGLGSEQNNFVSDDGDTKDWKVTSDTTLWTGTLNVNIPCPIGYRLPTADELTTDYSLISLHYAGYRDGQTGNLLGQDNYGTYWTSESGTYVKIDASGATKVSSSNNADGRCVRCIKQPD